MYRIPHTVVATWTTMSRSTLTVDTPTAINVRCPHCAYLVTFTLSGHELDSSRHTVASTGSCPQCQVKIRIWAVRPWSEIDKELSPPAVLLMYPAPATDRSVIADAHLVPEDIRDEYSNTLQAFNAGLWPLAAGAARRTLEALAYEILPAEQHEGQLYALLNRIPTAIDLGKPIHDLAHAIRDMGNKGAHVDRKVVHSEQSVTALIDALEYLLVYFYTLPGRIEALKQSVERVANEPT